MHTFRITAISGMGEREIACNSMRIYSEDGTWVELHPRRSDGEITLAASRRLMIQPTSSNSATVWSHGS